MSGHKLRVGFVGLGIMGQSMAMNVLKAGAGLVVYNRTISKTEPLKDAGAAVQTEGLVTINPVRYIEVGAPECPTGVDFDEDLPETFYLSQNYPNPFNAQTEIAFELGNAVSIDLSVYDIAGRKVATLANGILEAGHHSAVWNAEKFSSGIYFYQLETESESYSRKMTLLK